MIILNHPDHHAVHRNVMHLVEPLRVEFEVGGAGPLAHRYREQSRYREFGRYGVGAAAPSSVPIPGGGDNTGGGTAGGWMRTPPGGGGGDGGGGNCGRSTPQYWDSSGCTAGTGRRVTYDHNYSCEVRPPKCACQVIGGNTLVDTSGIASATFGDVLLDSGDADFFVPYYMYITAVQVGSAATLAITGASLPVLLNDSKSGREPNMRRASDTDPSFGVNTQVYGQFKDLECVDWRKFASINNQQLRLRFYNPNEVAVHVFVNLWGIPGVNAG